MTNPNKDSGKQQKHDGDIHERGAIEAHPPESLIKQHNAERKEDTTAHIAEREEDRRRETHKLLLEVVTLLAVIVYAGITWWQGSLTRQSVEGTRKQFQIDQRPWIKISTDMPIFMKVGEAPAVKVHMVDYGKTPAKSIHGDFVIEKVINGESPKLEYPIQRMNISLGMMYPNTPEDAQVVMMDESAGDKFVPKVFTKKELDDFMGSAIFFVMYAKVEYTDFAHVEHWTHYCTFILPPPPPPILKG